jgi:serine O-acetyltransferase
MFDESRSTGSANPATEPFVSELAPRVGSAPATPSLWQLVAEDYVAHGCEASRPGFQALLVYRFGVARMKVKPLLLRAPLSVLYRTLFRSVRNFYGIELPFTAQIGRRVIFEHQHGIVVHGATVIGDDCIIRQGVTLGIRTLDKLDDAPILGKKVNVGAGAKVIGNVRVGDGASIGANAVVLEDVPARALAVGVPARVVSIQEAKNGQSGRTLHSVDTRSPREQNNVDAVPGR